MPYAALSHNVSFSSPCPSKFVLSLVDGPATSLSFFILDAVCCEHPHSLLLLYSPGTPCFRFKFSFVFPDPGRPLLLHKRSLSQPPTSRAFAASDFSYATQDGGKDSASFYGEPPKGGSFFRDAADAAKDTVKDVEGIFKVRERPRQTYEKCQT